MYRCASMLDKRVALCLGFQRARLCSSEQVDVFTAGQYCLLFDAKGRRNMIKLNTSKSFHNRLGVVDHNAIIGMQPGCTLHSHRRNKFRAFRPSLEEYVVLMERRAAPAYPKDVTTMLSMMDVGPGSRIIEAGSGSGAMTLFLSRAVCPGGHVYSFDLNAGHQKVAQHNYQEWLGHVGATHGETSGWENNVSFILADVASREMLTEIGQVHGIALDVQQPQNVLSVLAHSLLPSGVVAVYLPNITQMAELVQRIHREKIPLSVERVVEVVHRSWEVSIRSLISEAPKGHSHHHHQQQSEEEKEEEEEGEKWGGDKEEENRNGGSAGSSSVQVATPTVCLARPHHRQEPHTAFLAKLRKVNETGGLQE